MKKKYMNIYDDITYKIKSEEYQSGDILPSEHDLLSQYNTSRETIRKALNLLSEHGYIQKIQGKGSVVLDVNKVSFPISGLVSFKELSEKINSPISTNVITFQETTTDKQLKNKLELPSPEKIWEISRVREIEGEKTILDKDFILKNVAPTLTKEIAAVSIYQYIEETRGLTISFAKKEITVEEPTREDRDVLDMEDFSSIVVVKNYVYLEDTTLFQYTESRHRPDKFKFVDFARRNR
ncbi:trehalose operon repressor [Salibacterium salarium]|uniref:Trehalose operon repressor n=1 Tax=Salibacterium salarium TaxID=284579 RepID=A0A3R9QHT9_9BACI|nr:trehalose operon repressor [Salibacterium salarium]RSL30709.1 trehalose operon repressor [Salibacterium salarium]